MCPQNPLDSGVDLPVGWTGLTGQESEGDKHQELCLENLTESHTAHQVRPGKKALYCLRNNFVIMDSFICSHSVH